MTHLRVLFSRHNFRFITREPLFPLRHTYYQFNGAIMSSGVNSRMWVQWNGPAQY